MRDLTVTAHITWQQRSNQQGRDGRIAILDNGHGDTLEIWPALGFNAYRWVMQGRELLYADPQLFGTGKPTRSGMPILFPFPNRIRAGTFTWDGKTYHLPLNDPAGKNAIHGWACRSAWRVVDEGSDASSTWLTGEFLLSRDAPEALPLWPADARLHLTYRLMHDRLRIEAAVIAGDMPLPYGLGFHPYFLLDAFGGDDAVVVVPAHRYWELADNLPTGEQLPVAGPRDLRFGQPLKGLTFDDVLTDLPTPPLHADSEVDLLGIVRHPAGGPGLGLYGTPEFREVVVFTPPHRQAVCLEPYTCTTDAINLEQAGVAAGWRVLPAGGRWQGMLEIVMMDHHAA